jgi:dynein heavy chain
MLILRALIDVNLPKFLSQDIPLFEGIVSDLFPATKPPTPGIVLTLTCLRLSSHGCNNIDYGDLMTAIRENITKMNLQPDENFIMKVLQLYETILVRHGLMIVGLPFAGKTTCYRVLQAALTDLDRMRLMNERAPKVTIINPKAVTIG